MLKKFLNTGNHSQSIDLSLLLLRVAFSVAMLTHGYGKFMKVINGDLTFGDPIGIGPELSLILVAFAEFVCSILVILGLTTRFALIPLIIAMFVAWQFRHGGDPFSSQEKSVLYLIVYFALLITGPGGYSMDKKLFG